MAAHHRRPFPFLLWVIVLLGLVLPLSCSPNRIRPDVVDYDVYPLILQFGRVEVGARVERSFYVRNTGTLPLDVEIQAACSGYRVLDGEGTATLPAGDSLRVMVEYAPTAGRETRCNIEVSTSHHQTTVQCLGNSLRTWAVAADGSGDAPTVQAAIDSAISGDTIVVGPGHYYENIDFLGKNITLRSAEGPEVTILDGSTRDSSVVMMRHDETRSAVLEGFTVTGGRGWKAAGVSVYGGGVMLVGASATIRNNVIVKNQARIGGGLATQPSKVVSFPDPLIENNTFQENSCTLDGGAVEIAQGNQVIRNNKFCRNSAYADGGAIWLWQNQGRVTIEGNEFLENVAGDHGAGIYAAGNHSLTQIRIEGNLFIRNRTTGPGFFGDTGSGAAVAILQTDGVVRSNTMVENDGHHLTDCGGGGLLLYLTGVGLVVVDNIIVDNQQCGIACWWAGTTATMRRNLLWNNAGGNLGIGDGGCPSTWADSMIVADPLFCDPANDDFHVAENSPAIHGKEVMGAYREPGCGPKPPATANLWKSLGIRHRN